VHFVGVGTPQRAGSYAADLTYVDAAISGLIPHLAECDLVVGRSTMLVGAAARLSDVITESGSGVSLVRNPKFLRDVFTVQDTISPDRLVYGVAACAKGERSTALLNEVYSAAIAA